MHNRHKILMFVVFYFLYTADLKPVASGRHNDKTIRLEVWYIPYSIRDVQGILQLCSKLFNPPCGYPMISIVNKSCNIESCVNMLQIIPNMTVSQGSELELSMFRGSTLSGQHPLIYVWVQNLQKYSTPWSHWYIIISSSKP